MEKTPAHKPSRSTRVAMAVGEVLASGGYSLLNRRPKLKQGAKPHFKSSEELAMGDGQTAILRNFLLKAHSFEYEDFIGFITSKWLLEDKPDDFFAAPLTRSTLREIGRGATDWAISLKEYAAASAWPEDAVSPEFIYGEFQQWLEDEETQKITIDGLTVKEFYTHPTGSPRDQAK